MKKWIPYGLAFLLLLSCGRGGDTGPADWPLFRGDPGLSGYTSASLPDQPELLWAFVTGPRTVSSPVVKDGIAYWCDRRGKLHGVDSSGKEAFLSELGTFVEATATIGDSLLYIGTIDGSMLALSLQDGHRVWQYDTEGQLSATPNLVDFNGRKALVFGSYDNWLYCVDALDGTLISRYESGYYLNGAVALQGESMIFGGCDEWVRVIDCRSGIQTDSLRLDAYIPASPAVWGDAAYVGDYGGSLYELRLSGGRIVSHRKIRRPDSQEDGFNSVPAVDPDNVYIITGSRTVLCLRRSDGRLLWDRLLKGGTGESSPLVCRDKLVACTKTGIVSILDKHTGEVLWEYDAGEDIISSPAVAGGRLLVLTAKGTLLCFGKR